MANSDNSQIPPVQRPRFAEIVSMTDAFCKEQLNDEYAELCEMLAAQLCSVKRSPVSDGRAKSWAGGILYTVGKVNFLSDPASNPHMTLGDLCTLLGVSPATASAKCKEICDLFDIVPMDPRLSLRRLLDSNPLVWMVELKNGVIADVRMLSREIQAQAFELGLIPYLPSDREESASAS